MKLYPFQRRVVNDIYTHFDASPVPVVVEVATGAGKSHIIAQLCFDLPHGARALVLTHNKEIVQQNANKLFAAYDNDPMAPIGVYSAGLGSRRIDRITVASIQSVYKCPEMFGEIHTLIIDECHLINHKGGGMYNKMIAALHKLNPAIRVVGFTATPYRLGGGYLHIARDLNDTGRIFRELLQPVTMSELLHDGYLAPLHSKHTQERMDTTGVRVRQGDFVEADLYAATSPEGDARIVHETVHLGADALHWLFFCSGVDHAENLAAAFRGAGIPTAAVHGRLDMADRNRRMLAHQSGQLRCLTNCNIMTTGYDFPDLDLIGFARPTLSPGLYLQMAGRGMRLKSHTDRCLVLDYAGLVSTHGPVTHVRPPKVRGGKRRPAPVKICPNEIHTDDGGMRQCAEIVFISAKVCPACGYKFPGGGGDKDDMMLHDDDIMGDAKSHTAEVDKWVWAPLHAQGPGWRHQDYLPLCRGRCHAEGHPPHPMAPCAR